MIEPPSQEPHMSAFDGFVGLTTLISDFGITEADFAQIAADALDDEMLANAPRQPTKDDIGAILLPRAG